MNADEPIAFVVDNSAPKAQLFEGIYVKAARESPKRRRNHACLQNRRRFGTFRAFLCAGLCVFLSDCNSFHGNSKPVIEFTQVPPADEGGPDKLGIIAGRVVGSHDGQYIVVFARAGVWWLQTGDHPLTILPDSTWKFSTHLGTEYAALLVGPGYHSSATVEVLPPEGGPITAIATVKGGPSSVPPPTTLQFSGYEWKARRAMSTRNGFATSYDPGNVQVDSKGSLHLRIVHQADRWTCAEVILEQSLGYGTYLFHVRDVSSLDPNLIFSMYTWDELGTEQNHREMNIEISRWADPHNTNARYVIQPYYIPINVAGFTAPPGNLTHSLRWEPGEASFETIRGSMTTDNSRVIAKHVFRSGIPSPGGESVRMSFCYVGISKVPRQSQAEVVVDGFQYLP